uniref:F-box domain-containing protein n=1 Tax=Davidia involucrata TaxID=16924 RepID=A0A5B7BJ11_DAVIN
MRGHDRINSILPDELILEIFRHLDSKSSRDACSLVCKRWLDLERLSRDTIRIGASGSPDALVKLLARRFVNVTNVHIDERLSVFLPVQYGRRRGGDQSTVSPFKLHYLPEKSGSEDGEVVSYYLSDAGLTAVGEGFTKLEKLSLIWCSNVTSVGLKSIAEKCRSLRSLDLQVNT